MSLPSTKKYHGRRFMLNKPGHHSTAAIVAEVEDTSTYDASEMDQWFHPHIILQLSDCDRKVTFDFDLNSKEDRANNLFKVDRMIQALTEFREGLALEQASYAARQRGNRR